MPTTHRLASLVVLSLFFGCARAGQPAGEPSAEPDPILPGTPSTGSTSDPVPVTPDPGHPDPGTPAKLTVSFIAPDNGATKPVDTLMYSLPFWVRVTGAQPNQRVTLTSTLAASYSGQVTFVASATGTVDTSTDAPTGGAYTGVDPDGLVWSMTSTGGTPDGTLDVKVEARTETATASATLHRLGMGMGTTQVDVATADVKGQFLKWAGGPKRPAVLVLGGSECSLDFTAFSASYMTTLGYHALAIDYCTPQHVISEVPVEKIVAAVDWLVAQPEVDASKIGVYGYSRGGELSLQLAALEPRITAVIASVPSPYRWADTATATRAAWTWRGAPLAIIPDSPNQQPRRETLPGGGVGYRYAPIFVSLLAAATPAERQAATIPFAASNAQFLLVGAGDDGMWPSCDFVSDAWKLLTAAGHPGTHGSDTQLCVPQTGHLLGAPGWPTGDDYALYDPQSRTSTVMGGTAAGQGRGDRAFDTAWRAFFRATLGSP